MIVHDEDALYGATHAKVFIIVLEPLKTRRDRGVFFGLGFFGAIEGLVARCRAVRTTHLNVKLERG